MTKLQLLYLALIAAIITSCASMKRKSKENFVELTSTSWQVEELNGRAITPQENNFTLLFGTDGALNGRGACNIMFGQYEQGKDGKLTLSPQGLTRTACPDMGVEDEYIKMLGEVTSYSVIDGKLHLYNDEELAATLNEANIEL